MLQKAATCNLLVAAAIAVSLSLSSPGASAEAGKSGTDDWKVRASIYGWLPSIDVKSNFPVPPAIVAAQQQQQQAQAATQQQQTAFANARAACLQGRGYSVK